jgi:hypothetical protein
LSGFIDTLVVRFGYHATLFALGLGERGGIVGAVGKWESPEAISKERWKTGVRFSTAQSFPRPTT